MSKTFYVALLEMNDEKRQIYYATDGAHDMTGGYQRSVSMLEMSAYLIFSSLKWCTAALSWSSRHDEQNTRRAILRQLNFPHFVPTPTNYHHQFYANHIP